jgi:hypothetical protein
LNHSSFCGSPQEFLANSLLIQASNETDARLAAAGNGVANGRGIIRPQIGWNGNRGDKQQGGEQQQSFLHGVISFSGELRRDNVLIAAVCFTGLG